MPSGERGTRHIERGLRPRQSLHEQRVNGVLQGGQIERFGKKSIPKCRLLPWRNTAGCHNYRNLSKSGIAFQMFAQANAIHAWHIPVSHDQIGKALRGRVKGGLTALSEKHAVTMPYENNLE